MSDTQQTFQAGRRIDTQADEQVEREGIPLKEALETLAAFADGAKLWSWGKDELNLLAISCFIAGITPTLPAHMFDNACKLMLKAGMPYEGHSKNPKWRSGGLFQASRTEREPPRIRQSLHLR